MPPVITSAQGSRSGLVTAVIVSVVIAVVMIVIAVYCSQKQGDAERTLAEVRTQDRELVSDAAAGDPRVAVLKASMGQGQYSGLNDVLDVALAQSDQLAKLVGGNLTPDKAAQQAQNTLTASAKRIDALNSQKLVNFTLPTNASLATAVSTLTDQVAAMAQESKNKDDQIAAAEASKQQLIAAQKEQTAQKDKLIQEADAKVQATQAALAQYQQQGAQAVAAVQGTAGADLKKLQDANAALTAQLNAANKKVKDDDTLLAGLKSKLHDVRVNPSDAVVQQADGQIVRLSDQNTCFINIGSHQSVTKGLTFEVYDKNKGIPPLGDGRSDTNMPVGKASIEVFAVGPDSSECRIIRSEPGQQIVIGDLISNLVFDPNTKYNFVVYGNFDLSNNGNPNPTDTQLIKRLITQWGGRIQDHIDVDTDFVVMGAEPIVPPGDPTNAEKQLEHNAAEKQLELYHDQIAAADQLSIPIMNQNRFLYFIGYYDMARR